jgi:DNA-binding response OmpR family regulator
MTPVKVVIVEDETSIRQLYETKLRKEGFDVRTAKDGVEGLETIREFAPELVLLDLRMPVMPGDEMLAKLREEEWGANVRVVILTNLSRDEAPSSLRFLGVDRYVVKAHHTPSQIVSIAREVLHMGHAI